ncbi:mucin-2-like [Pygocentrus nattereri]|uniref:mucin-2-like n=1 Tax=Pygocentrus nattereri TaxID=42514 RepID=UPI001890BB84|nr:mucin-2-like [Pygocentrus nattereri]
MQVCSTWGNFHFSTFDGQIFQLPYTCNYILTTLRDSTKTDFNIQMRRQYINNLPTISSFTINIDGVVVKLLHGNITMNDKAVAIPIRQYGVWIEKTTSYIKISSSKLEITVLWDLQNFLSVEIPTKYKNQTCGLCGDFNGLKDNDLFDNDVQLTEHNFGIKWKMDAPTETCEEIEPQTNGCQSQKTSCEQLLSHPAFSSCYGLLPIKAFVDACVRDMCQCNSSHAMCMCDTISEFSRQCAHAGGKPQSWRTSKLCGKECPFNLEHRECGSPCKDTCSNQEGSLVCSTHCNDGCFCPTGTVFNDIEENGCIPVVQCPCIHSGKVYKPGESYNTTCQKCKCSEGRWSCVNLDCPGSCSIQGGSHITTYDGKAYNFHGNCYYVLSKDSINDVTVLGHLVQCGQTETETCLTDVKFIVSGTSVTVSSTGSVLVNEITTKLPILNDDVTVFKPSTFYIIARSPDLLLVIQMVPVMQVYILASSKKKGTLSGLCGNFNDVQADDFKTKLGLTEGTGATFANTWKAMSNCPDISISQENPCSMSVEKEKYAMEWCNMLINPRGVFSPCHAEVNPNDYKDRCIYDTCNCAKSEECMCAAVSSYVYACAAKRVQLHGWRNATCGRFSADCPGNMVYYYSLSGCATTCRSLSAYDYTCQVSHTPVDGCGCAKGTYLDDKGKCVPDSSCPCYYNNQIVAPSQVISKAGTKCTCTRGKLYCNGQQQVPTCKAPMYFFNCSNAGPEARGTECQKSCQTLDSDQCVSAQCISGCVCPDGLLADGQEGCVKEESCTCVHNGVFYQPGQTVKEDCNTCTCKGGTWNCTRNKCPGTCTIYGDGHYITFDGRRYSFSGDCEYTLVQDYCSNTLNGSFRVITENIPCGTTGTTCSKSIKIFLGNKELLLSEENIVIYDNSTEFPQRLYTVGIYLVIEVKHGLVLFWDKKTSLMIKLEPWFKGTVCGLCGNYDGNGKNDFVTRGGEEVVDPLEFGNSWRVSPTCPKTSSVSSPCDMRPHRQTWAVKHCSIIKSDVFSACHSLVNPAQYYDICVQDTCACDSGGDCECFCTAVAAYAAACNGKGACISWRTPTICPLFCDYYNSPDGCEWHYKPCGQCVKTCRNPSGDCFNQTLVEGCFPNCPSERPYLNEKTMKCISKPYCGCNINNQHYDVGQQIPSEDVCKKCNCSLEGPSCYNEKGKVLNTTTNGNGTCFSAECGPNGEIISYMFICYTSTTISTTSTTVTTTERKSTSKTTKITTTLTPSTTPVTASTLTAKTSPTTTVGSSSTQKTTRITTTLTPSTTPVTVSTSTTRTSPTTTVGSSSTQKTTRITTTLTPSTTPVTGSTSTTRTSPTTTVGSSSTQKTTRITTTLTPSTTPVTASTSTTRTSPMTTVGSSSTQKTTRITTTLTPSTTPVTGSTSTTRTSPTTTVGSSSTQKTTRITTTLTPSTTPVTGSTSTTRTSPTTTVGSSSTQKTTRITTTLTPSTTPVTASTSTTRTSPTTTVGSSSTQKTTRITTTLTPSTTPLTASTSTTRTSPTTTVGSSSTQKTTRITTTLTPSTTPVTASTSTTRTSPTTTVGSSSTQKTTRITTTLTPSTTPLTASTSTTRTSPTTTVGSSSTQKTTRITTTLTPSTTPVTASTSTTRTSPTTTVGSSSTQKTTRITTTLTPSTTPVTASTSTTRTSPTTTVGSSSTQKTTRITTTLTPSTTPVTVSTSTTRTSPTTTVGSSSTQKTTRITTTLTPSTTPVTGSTSTTRTSPTTTVGSSSTQKTTRITTTLTPSTTPVTASTSTTRTSPTTTVGSSSTQKTTRITTTLTPSTTPVTASTSTTRTSPTTTVGSSSTQKTTRITTTLTPSTTPLTASTSTTRTSPTTTVGSSSTQKTTRITTTLTPSTTPVTASTSTTRTSPTITVGSSSTQKTTRITTTLTPSTTPVTASTSTTRTSPTTTVGSSSTQKTTRITTTLTPSTTPVTASTSTTRTSPTTTSNDDRGKFFNTEDNKNNHYINPFNYTCDSEHVNYKN